MHLLEWALFIVDQFFSPLLQFLLFTVSDFWGNGLQSSLVSSAFEMFSSSYSFKTSGSRSTYDFSVSGFTSLSSTAVRNTVMLWLFFHFCNHPLEPLKPSAPNLLDVYRASFYIIGPLIGFLRSAKPFPYSIVFIIEFSRSIFLLNPLSANPIKWSACQRIVWVCLAILWGWHLKG